MPIQPTNTQPIEIDGSRGEGGGQVLRTSLAAAALLQRPIQLYNIRAGRKTPGLRRQHMTAARAIATICGGESTVRGARVGSRELRFDPGPIQPGDYHFDVGTAGSTTLVLQTILPALMVCDGVSTVLIEGGTHNMMAPPFDFVEKAFVPALARLGARVRVTMERAGFYPKGGGAIRAEVEPPGEARRLQLTDRGTPEPLRARILLSKLPGHIAERERARLVERLGLRPSQIETVRLRRGKGPGNVVLVELPSGELTEVFTGFGQKGVPAERVADGLADAVLAHLDSGVPVGPHLADQLLLPMVALGAGGELLTSEPTRHTTTNAALIEELFQARVSISAESRGDGDVGYRITVATGGDS